MNRQGTSATLWPHRRLGCSCIVVSLPLPRAFGCWGAGGGRTNCLGLGRPLEEDPVEGMHVSVQGRSMVERSWVEKLTSAQHLVKNHHASSGY